MALSLLATPMVARAADEAPAEKAKPYPLQTCLVSGEKLGEMGDAYVFTHESQEIKLCCKDCLKEFQKEPAKYLKKLEAKPAAGDPHAGHNH